MTFVTTWPDGTKSVKVNETAGAANMAYIQTKQRLDHYWGEDAAKDGHHRKVEMPKQTSAPALSASMDGLMYFLDNVSTEPFYRNTGGIMQMLGIRAMAVFQGTAVTGDATQDYSYNVVATTGVQRTAKGLYEITYSTALPNTNYLVLGGAMRNDGTVTKELIFYVQAATAVATTKSTTVVKVMCKGDGGTLYDPLQMWAVCFGG